MEALNLVNEASFENGLVIVALVAALTQILKGAICGDDAALRDRWAPAIALTVGVVIAGLVTLGQTWVLVGLVDAMIAVGSYKGAAFGIRSANTPAPPKS